MKTCLRFLHVFAVVLLSFAVWSASGCKSQQRISSQIPTPEDSRAQPILPVVQIRTPENKVIAAEVARTAKERQTGLMFRSQVPRGTGMLFVFSDEDYRQIWMKNTWVDLDLIFIDKNRRVYSIAKNVTASRPDQSDETVEIRVGFGKYCLEVAAGESARLHLTKNTQLYFNVNQE